MFDALAAKLMILVNEGYFECEVSRENMVFNTIRHRIKNLSSFFRISKIQSACDEFSAKFALVGFATIYEYCVQGDRAPSLNNFNKIVGNNGLYFIPYDLLSN